jgi:hypothetical protein
MKVAIILASAAIFGLVVILMRVQAELRKRLARRDSVPGIQIGPPVGDEELDALREDALIVADAYESAGRPIGVLVTGPHPETGIITVLDTDEYLPSLLGITREQFLAENWAAHIDPRDIDRTLREVRAPRGEMTNRYIAADGRAVHILWRWMRDSRGRGYSLAAQHLGRAAEDRMDEYRDALEERRRAREGAAHG